MKQLSAAALLIVLLSLHVMALTRAAGAWNEQSHGEDRMMVLPTPLLRILALEFDGIVSDFLYLESTVYIGKKLEQDSRLKLSTSEWGSFYALLQAATDMDPYFADPYYVGNAYLTWYANMLPQANELMDKAVRSRSWDWVPPFFLGFNNFYFLKNNDRAADALMESVRRGASPTVGSLASRLAEKDSRTKVAISFLQEVIKRANDPVLKKQYATRLVSLKNVSFLEDAIKLYRRKYGRKPLTLNDLVASGLIDAIPMDPLGGGYFLDINGKIQSASDMGIVQWE